MIHALRTLRSVYWPGNAFLIAASKLLVEVALISDTFAIDISSSLCKAPAFSRRHVVCSQPLLPMNHLRRPQPMRPFAASTTLRIVTESKLSRTVQLLFERAFLVFVDLQQIACAIRHT